MNSHKSLDVIELFSQELGDKLEEFNLPPPSFEIMQSKIIEFNKEEASILVKMPVLESWLNPYGTMQGGLIIGAIDNAVGPLSLLIAPKNMTRNIESKLIKPIVMSMEYIYVTATLFEQKKRRLIFDVVVKDEDNNIYATAKITNWIL
jgi:acyl-coenzyme A thioesterase PaaI-like protein